MTPTSARPRDTLKTPSRRHLGAPTVRRSRTRLSPLFAAYHRLPPVPELRYIRPLGSGQFGQVWLVFDEALNVYRAVKQVHMDLIHDPNIYKEPQSLLRLKHPNVVEVYDAGRASDYDGIYILMEFFPRGSVEKLGGNGILPRAMRWAGSLAAAYWSLRYTNAAHRCSWSALPE